MFDVLRRKVITYKCVFQGSCTRTTVVVEMVSSVPIIGSSLSAVISTARDVPNLYVSRRELKKYRVNWTAVSEAIDELPW